ncbi:hypothetical protein HOU03_gp237 [Caulobacter phage CcrSC]|uniref:Uncharacterized protein n=1 Tax=Caulobacter phage CcrSC TaxID=2283272 RepID=A0A385EDT3_9CAUD|nr:hypothetical protein HOU03_gp237 [Caulobacter phage CcrSC]AXQ70031.1 hypothetical protein CcrSC_gp449 [Caulobacter phage CcrSC]
MSWFDDFKAWLGYTRQHKNPEAGEFRIHQFAPNSFVVQIFDGGDWKGLSPLGRIANFRAHVEFHESFDQAVEKMTNLRARWSRLYEGEIERLLGSEINYYPESLHPVRKHGKRSWKVENKATEVALKGFGG